MKYYHELIEIENISIDLDVLQSTVRVLTYGMPGANKHDVEYAMHNITDQLESLSERLRNRFDTLFDAIRNEKEENEAKGRKTKTSRSV